ncbi:MAG TPA: carboxypeptidase regulatory-like domain-containing protein [Verrucomicrobiae bacterium]|nr:carboxypeptidase regulatory-like domain-containing protein [Verrucomicrobiae bacterium]
MCFKKFAVLSTLTFATLPLFTATAGAVGSISGQVKLEHEVAVVPVVGAAVSAISADSHFVGLARVIDTHFVATARTDSNGNYQIDNLPADRYKVVACKAELGCLFYPGVRHPDSAQWIAVVDDEVTSGINVTFRPFIPPPPNPALITGRVTDAETGEGIANALVGASGEFLTIIFQTRTGPDGRYELSVAAGGYFVRAVAHGYLPGEHPGNPVRLEAYDTVSSVDIALRPLAIEFGSLSGQVINAATGTPIPHALVVARQGDGFGYGSALTDSGGHYRIGPLPAGFYKVAAMARGFFPAVYPDPVGVRAGENTPDINFRLHPVPPPDLGTISGMITDDSTGEPIGCAVVAAIGFDSTFHHRIVRYAHTDSTGNYVIEGLPRIPYFVVAWARGYLGEIYDNVRRFAEATKVTPDASGINFALERKNRDSTALSLAGVVQSNASIPLTGAFVQVTDDGGSTVNAGLSLPDGGFMIEGLVPGNYTVSASLDAASVSQNVDLSGGSVAGVSLTLPVEAALRGDINQNGTYEPSDVVLLINGVFSDSGLLPDRAAADVNCDGKLSPADVVAALQLVFTGQSTAVCGF